MMIPRISLLVLAFVFGTFHSTQASDATSLVIVGPQDADLCRALKQCGSEFVVAANTDIALSLVKDGGAVAILAAGYPEKTTFVPESFFSKAADRSLSVYIEYPQSLPGLEVGNPVEARWERVVVASDALNPQLKRMRIMSMNRCRYVRIHSDDPLLVLARVAGFDEATYGIPSSAATLLSVFPATETRPELYVATSKLSDFITARYAPSTAWEKVWNGLLGKLDPALRSIDLKWSPTVRPTYVADQPLPADAERLALQRGAQWFIHSGLLLTQKSEAAYQQDIRKGEVADVTPYLGQFGDGRNGMLEGFDSGIHPDGSQGIRVIQRSDCISETAMGLSVAGKVLGDQNMTVIGQNLQEYLYERSGAVGGERGDPNHPSFGMIAWGVSNQAWRKANYGDDIARVLLATMATESVTGDQRWNPYVARAVVAELRTCGPLGYKPSRIDQAQLAQNGWQHYFSYSSIHPSPHFQSYLWACYLWAYRQSGDELLLERARTGIRLMMERYPDQWRWTNGIQQERARMLLPLAWLVRVDGRPEHHQWLQRIAKDLIACQDASGAIREELGPLDRGAYPPHANNESFGAHEAPLIHRNGEPVSDLLYTTNFAFLGLHEAAAATGDPFYQDAEDKLAQFLCRIQTRSEDHPELDGAWMRAFDYQRWDYWGSNGDAGWGAWSIESGWTQGWIVAVFGFRLSNTNLWDVSQKIEAGEDYKKFRSTMMPEAVVAAAQPKRLTHAALHDSVTFLTTPASQYSDLGTEAITNGYIGSTTHQDSQWIGIEGKPLVMTIDFSKPIRLQTVAIHALQSTPVGIYFPTAVRVSVSNDGKTFKPWASAPIEIVDSNSSETKWFSVSGDSINAKSMKVEIETRGTIPSGHHAVGKPAWLFVSELAANPSLPLRKDAK